MGALQRTLFNKQTVVRKDPQAPDPESLPERLRKETDLEKGTGFAKLFGAYIADLSQILTSSPQWSIVSVSLIRARIVKTKGAEPRRKTPPLAVPDLALMNGCTERHIERELKNLSAEGNEILRVERDGRGLVVLEPLTENWPKIARDKALKKPPAIAEEPDPGAGEEEDQEPQPIAKEAVKVFRARGVRAGRASRPAPIHAGVKSLRLENRTDWDLRYDAVVDRGELVVVASSEGQKSAPLEARSNGIREIDHRKRHICRGEGLEAGETPEVGSRNGHHGNSGSPTGRSNGSNNLSDPKRHICPNGRNDTNPSCDPKELRSGLRRIGFSLTDTLFSRLFSSVPAGCSSDFVLGRVQQRVDRGRKAHKPVTDAVLVSWFAEDLPQLWEDAEASDQEIRAQLPTCGLCHRSIDETEVAVNGCHASCWENRR